MKINLIEKNLEKSGTEIEIIFVKILVIFKVNN